MIKHPGVLLVTVWYGGTSNGVGLVVESLAQSFQRAQIPVTVLVLVGDGWRPFARCGGAGEEIVSVCVRHPDESVGVLRRLAAHAHALIAAWTIRRLIRRRSLGIAHFHYAFAQYDIVRPVLQRLGLPMVVTFHGNDLGVNMTDTVTRAAAEQLLRASAVATTVSASLGSRLRELFPFAAPIARTVHNAIPEAFLASLEDAPPIARDIDVFFAGNLIARKGVDVLIRALARAKGHKRGFGLVIAGDGPERDALEELTRSLGVADIVSFVGQQSRDAIVQLFRRARVAAIPSRSEPFGLVVVEALAAGARVVASDVGGIAEIAEEVGGVILVPPDDPDALARAIIDGLDEPTTDVTAAAASERARSAFSPDTIRAAYIDAYRAALGMDSALTQG